MNTPQQSENDSFQNAKPAGGRRRFRFSLATLVLVAAVVCLVVSHLRTSLLLFDANRELRQFRKELGYLHVTDRGRIHAIAVPVHGEFVWQWRVYLPEGRKYELHTQVGSIAREGLPARSHPELSLEGGEETLITMAVYRDPLDQWKLRITLTPPAGGISARTLELSDDQVAWIANNPGYGSAGVLPGGNATSFDRNDPAMLMRLRVHERHAGGGSGTADGPADGLLIWIVEEE